MSEENDHFLEENPFTIDPKIRPGSSPAFYDLGEYPFQELCRDLLEAETAIATCSIYGTRGQLQEGIDLIAFREDGESTEVGQCKCYQHFSEREIREVSDVFFKYWKKWSKENIKRFILFIACDLDKRQPQEEIINQKKRFHEKGIIYEVWGASTIRNKLRSQPGIVASHLDPEEYWIKAICGQNISSYSTTGLGELKNSQTMLKVANIQIEEMADILSKESEINLEQMREAWREGQNTKALEWIKNLKTEKPWELLSNNIRGRLLRFEAALELEISGNISLAKSLADQAKIIDPSSDSEARLQSLIVRQEQGNEKAVEVLKNHGDIGSLNMLAAIYLELGQKQNCQNILEKINSTCSLNAETYRITALFHLVNNDIQNAKKYIDMAKSISPNWQSIKLNSAMIDYYSAISLSILPDNLTLFPHPIDWMLIKRDTESTESINRATKQFEELIDIEELEDRKNYYKEWYLSCLMINYTSQELAIRYLQSYIKSNPSDPHAISWALSRNVQFDYKSSIKALKKFIENNKTPIFHITVLNSIYTTLEEYNKAENLLRVHKNTFEENEAIFLWAFWFINILSFTNKNKEALDIIKQLENRREIKSNESLILRSRIVFASDNYDLIQEFKNQNSYKKVPLLFLQICEFEYQNQNWNYIAENAEEIINLYKTAEVLIMCIIASFNAMREDLCLSIISKYSSFFPDNNLPPFIKRIKAYCLQSGGNALDAISELESINETEFSYQEILQKTNLYIQTGDIKKAGIISRELLSFEDVPSHQLLGVAQIIHQEDPKLAKDLWRKAVAQEIPDELLGGIMAIGIQFDLEDETEQIRESFLDAAEKGVGGIFRLKSLDEFYEFAKQSHRTQHNVEALYREGKIPIHFLSEQQNISLIDLYHRYLEKREQTPSFINQGYLMVRHGGKKIDKDLINKSKEWNLHLDITAILLAEHFQILDQVIDYFSPINIPSNLIPFLIELRGSVPFHQPSQLSIAHEITSLYDQRLISLCKSANVNKTENLHKLDITGKFERFVFYNSIKDQGGLILDFNNFNNIYDSISKEVRQSINIINCGSIINSLLKAGVLTRSKYQEIIKSLGNESFINDQVTVPLGASIYCFANILNVLAPFELLRAVSSNYKIIIQEEYLRFQKDLISLEQENIYIIDWIGELIEKLRIGINNKKIKLLPFYNPIDEDQSNKSTILYQSGLNSILRFNQKENDVIWIDDRFSNGFSNRDGIPIISIYEILYAWLDKKVIGIEKYTQHLNKFRSANLLFIPIEPFEIVHHLLEASIKNNEIIETEDLSLIRRYYASAILKGTEFQTPQQSDFVQNPDGEISFLLGFSNCIADTIKDIWQLSGKSISEKEILSNWIIDNLYTTQLAFSHVLNITRPIEEEQHLIALNFNILIIRAYFLDYKTNENGQSIRKEYLNWVYSKVINNSIEIFPHLLEITANIFKDIVNTNKYKILKNISKEIMLVFIQDFFNDLPAPLFEKLTKDEDFMENIGFNRSISIGKYKINPKNFWEATSLAINGNDASVYTIESNDELVFTIEKPAKQVDCILIKNKTTTEEFRINDPIFITLSSEPGQVEQILKANRGWFDCSNEKFKEICIEINNIENPQKRAEYIDTWRSESLNSFYSNLHRRILHKEETTYNDFYPPTVKGMIKYYRLSTQSDEKSNFLKAWQDSVDNLITSLGYEYSFQRICGLPFPLSNNIIELFINTSDKRSLVKKLLNYSMSPISIVHLTKVLFLLGKSDPLFNRLARIKTSYLLSEEFKEVTASFILILKCVYTKLISFPGFSKLSNENQLTLVWGHTHHLFSILSSLGAPIKWITEFFSQQKSSYFRDTFELNPEVTITPSHLNKINEMIFTTDSIIYMLQGMEDQTNIELKNMIKNYITVEIENQKAPSPLLLDEPMELTNKSNSFIGISRGTIIEELFEEEISELFSAEYFYSRASDIIEQLLSKRNNLSAWLDVFVIHERIVKLENLNKSLISQLIDISFVNMFDTNQDTCLFALLISSMQFMHSLDQSLYAHLITQFEEISIKYGQTYPEVIIKNLNSEEKNKIQEIVGLLLQIAMNLSKNGANPEKRAQLFSNNGSILIINWPSISSFAKPIISTLIEELPASQSKYLWDLLLLIRST